MYFCLQPFLVGVMHVRAWKGCRVSQKTHGPSVLLLPLGEREPYSMQAQDGLTFQAIVASKSGEGILAGFPLGKISTETSG